MGTVRQDLLASIERHYRGRPRARIAEVIRPPGGPAEKISPFTVVLLEGGVAGACWNLLEEPDRKAAYAAVEVEAYRGRPALEVARDLLHEDRARRIVGYAVCNALSQALFLAGEIAVDAATDLLDLASVEAKDHVGLVGYTPPLLARLRSREARITVLEHEGKMPVHERVQVAQTPRDLADCDAVLITSTTLLDDSFAEIESHTRHARFRAIYGPGAAIVPEALFRHGLDAIAGMLITDGAALAERQRSGQRWGDAKHKFVLRRPAE